MTFRTDEPFNQPDKFDPFADILFKHLFGDMNNKEIVLAYINAILARDGMDKIKDFSYLNIEIEPLDNDEKIPRLDFLLETYNNEQIILELQAHNYAQHPFFYIYYASNLYVQEVEHEMNFLELRKIICINIIRDYSNPDNEVISTFCFQNANNNALLTDKQQIYFVSVSALKERPLSSLNKVERYIKWLDRELSKKERAELAKEDWILTALNTATEKFFASRELDCAYMAQEKSLLNNFSQKDTPS